MDEGFETIQALLKLFELHNKGYKVEILLKGKSDSEKYGYPRLLDPEQRKFEDGTKVTDHKEIKIYLSGIKKEGPHLEQVCVGSGITLFVALKEVLERFENLKDLLLPFYYWRKE